MEKEVIYAESDVSSIRGLISKIDLKIKRALYYGDYKAYDKYVTTLSNLEKKLFDRIAHNIIARISKKDAN